MLSIIILFIFITTYFINEISLGVDLRGGASILLKVDLQSYYNDQLNTIYEINNKKYKNVQVSNNTVIIPNGQYIPIDDHTTSVNYVEDSAYLTYNKTDYETQQVIEQCIHIIKDRVDPTGTKELILQKYKDQFIRLQIPGKVDIDAVIKLIGTTAKLNFHIVEYEKNDQNQLYKFNNQDILIQKKIALNGNLINNANIVFNELNQPIISLSFNSQGSQKFAEITKKYRNHQLAIILDNKIISAPTISNEIINGKCTITGKFTTEEASELAYLLQKGALITSLEIVEQNTIGPTLGEYFIQQSNKAIYWIFGIITLFMLFTYKGLGIIVMFSLLTTMAMLYCCIFLFNITLTLSGIIGVLFTIGMAVDANVLINERIRELNTINANEVYKAVSKASDAIIDANLTSLIVGAIMYVCGDGVIKAFAIMLCLGIICSVIIAILISHTLLIYYIKQFKYQCKFLIRPSTTSNI